MGIIHEEILPPRYRFCNMHAIVLLPPASYSPYDVHSYYRYVSRSNGLFSFMVLSTLVYIPRTFSTGPSTLWKWRPFKADSPSTFVARGLKCASNVRCPTKVRQDILILRPQLFAYRGNIAMLAMVSAIGVFPVEVEGLFLDMISKPSCWIFTEIGATAFSIILILRDQALPPAMINVSSP